MVRRTKRRIAGTAAVSATALASLMGAAPASGQVCIQCEPGPPGGFAREHALLKIAEAAPVAVFNKIEATFNKIDSILNKE